MHRHPKGMIIRVRLSKMVGRWEGGAQSWTTLNLFSLFRGTFKNIMETYAMCVPETDCTITGGTLVKVAIP